MPNIFEFEDYRNFLQVYYDEKKLQKGSAYSYRTFSKMGGFKSPNFLQLVIQKKRNLTPSSIRGFIKALKFNDSEAAFFTYLVSFNQAKTSIESEAFFVKLQTLRRYREIKQLEEEEIRLYLSQWYHGAVRELSLLKEFKPDPEWIANALRPRIDVAQAKDSLLLLIKMGFLVFDGVSFVQSEPHLSTRSELKSEVVRAYHREMMERAKDSLENTVGSQREISSLTVAVSKDGFQKVKSRIQEIRRELNVLLEKEKNPEAVYQVNFQFFNLSEVPWGE